MPFPPLDPRSGHADASLPDEAWDRLERILDRFENAAVVKIVAAEWIDYLELAKVDGQWKIINVLWELKPRSSAAAK